MGNALPTVSDEAQNTKNKRGNPAHRNWGSFLVFRSPVTACKDTLHKNPAHNHLLYPPYLIPCPSMAKANRAIANHRILPYHSHRASTWISVLFLSARTRLRSMAWSCAVVAVKDSSHPNCCSHTMTWHMLLNNHQGRLTYKWCSIRASQFPVYYEGERIDSILGVGNQRRSLPLPLSNGHPPHCNQVSASNASSALWHITSEIRDITITVFQPPSASNTLSPAAYFPHY
jgi:hypothetical protein